MVDQLAFDAKSGAAASDYRLRTLKLLLIDLAICISAVAVLLVHCLLKSPRKLFWLDEVFTELVVRNSSLAETLASLKEPINAMPPGYFVGVWLWSQLFGTSEFALRSFSALAMGCAWVFCWLLLRQFSSRLTATAATAVTFFCFESIAHYNVEARGYAQYLAAFLGASLLLVRCWNRARPAGAAVFVGTMAAHALLVTTHYIGCIYCAALVTAAALGAWITRRSALAMYVVAAILGAMAFIPCLPYFFAQRTLAAQENWLERPGVTELTKAFNFGGQVRMPIVILLLALLGLGYKALLATRSHPTTADPTSPSEPERLQRAATLQAVFALCLVALFVPLAIWLESNVGVRLFLDRYLLPSVILWPCLMAVAFEQLDTWARQCGPLVSSKFGWLVGHSTQICCALLALMAAIDLTLFNTRQIDQRLQWVKEIVGATKQYDVEFVSTSQLDVLPVWHYGGRAQYLKVPDNPRKAAVALEAIDRRYSTNFILPSDEVCQGRWKFLVPRMELDNWLSKCCPTNDWRVERNVGNASIVDRLLIVER